MVRYKTQCMAQCTAPCMPHLLELLGEPHEPRQQPSQHIVLERRHLVGGRGLLRDRVKGRPRGVVRVVVG